MQKYTRMRQPKNNTWIVPDGLHEYTFPCISQRSGFAEEKNNDQLGQMLSLLCRHFPLQKHSRGQEHSREGPDYRSMNLHWPFGRECDEKKVNKSSFCQQLCLLCLYQNAQVWQHKLQRGLRDKHRPLQELQLFTLEGLCCTCISPAFFLQKIFLERFQTYYCFVLAKLL